MTEEHGHPIEELAAFALGALEGPEERSVEAHVGACPTCGRILEQYRAVVGTLPIGLDPVVPPPEALAAIRTAARARRPRARWWGKAVDLSGWLRASRWPALAAIVAALLLWNVVLQRELTRRAPGPAPGPEVEALSRRPGRLVILAGTGQPGASARLFVAVDGGGHLAISGMTPLPRERTYQLWFIRTGASTVTGGTFRVDTRGLAWVKITVPASLDEIRAIAVTEEPAPGSVSPTGHHLVEAKAWR